ncbi:hypothetical protein [Streptomyces paromomycinus]|uniref:hypothetical protein n=1 Tax=Streptomyces paromomycinus TaxID=92743 RepID=UPI001FE7C87D|nr:hypothetical protein [Streptomyces paromomycinus]
MSGTGPARFRTPRRTPLRTVKAFAAAYNTGSGTGGGGRQPDEPLSVSTTSRGEVVPESGGPAEGATVTWSSPDGGNGSVTFFGKVTFFDNGTRFEGAAQFPGEAPVGCRGRLAN